MGMLLIRSSQRSSGWIGARSKGLTGAGCMNGEYVRYPLCGRQCFVKSRFWNYSGICGGFFMDPIRARPSCKV